MSQEPYTFSPEAQKFLSGTVRRDLDRVTSMLHAVYQKLPEADQPFYKEVLDGFDSCDEKLKERQRLL